MLKSENKKFLLPQIKPINNYLDPSIKLKLQSKLISEIQ